MPIGRAAPSTWPAGQGADAPSIYLLSATEPSFEPASAATPLDRSDRSEPPSAPVNGDSTLAEDGADFGYPWYGRDISDAGPDESSNTPSTPESLRLFPEAESSASPEKPFR
jgi:hypothetical protein